MTAPTFNVQAFRKALMTQLPAPPTADLVDQTEITEALRHLRQLDARKPRQAKIIADLLTALVAAGKPAGDVLATAKRVLTQAPFNTL